MEEAKMKDQAKRQEALKAVPKAAPESQESTSPVAAHEVGKLGSVQVEERLNAGGKREEGRRLQALLGRIVAAWNKGMLDGSALAQAQMMSY